MTVTSPPPDPPSRPGEPVAAQAPSPADEIAALGSELADTRRQAEELAQVARLVNETLEPGAVGRRIADSVLGLLGVHSSAIRLVQADGQLAALPQPTDRQRVSADAPRSAACRPKQPPGQKRSDDEKRRPGQQRPGAKVDDL